MALTLRPCEKKWLGMAWHWLFTTPKTITNVRKLLRITVGTSMELAHKQLSFLPFTIWSCSNFFSSEEKLMHVDLLQVPDFSRRWGATTGSHYSGIIFDTNSHLSRTWYFYVISSCITRRTATHGTDLNSIHWFFGFSSEHREYFILLLIEDTFVTEG